MVDYALKAFKDIKEDYNILKHCARSTRSKCDLLTRVTELYMRSLIRSKNIDALAHIYRSVSDGQHDQRSTSTNKKRIVYDCLYHKSPGIVLQFLKQLCEVEGRSLEILPTDEWVIEGKSTTYVFSLSSVRSKRGNYFFTKDDSDTITNDLKESDCRIKWWCIGQLTYMLR